MTQDALQRHGSDGNVGVRASQRNRQWPDCLTTLHSRTGFVDGPLPHQKRHMLRLWLKFPKVWPLSAEFPTHMGYKPSKDTPELVEAER